MSNTHKHKLKGKFHSGILDYEEDEIPIQLQKQWARWNWDLGESRKKKKSLKEADLKKQQKKDLEKNNFKIID